MAIATAEHGPTDSHAADFYRGVLALLEAEQIPHLVGGAFALAHYTGIDRPTKDVDLFIRRADLERTLALAQRAGHETEVPFPHWLGKIRRGDAFIDLVYGSANGIAVVDDAWFEHSVRGYALGLPVCLCPVEETIWSKAFVMERERYDGADIAHLLHARGTTLDWRRLHARFGAHWRVLLSHLLLFGFVYPAERDVAPAWLMDDLLMRLRDELRTAPARERVCCGTLLSREQYLVDVEQWGFADARLAPRGSLTREQVAIWTQAIGSSH